MRKSTFWYNKFVLKKKIKKILPFKVRGEDLFSL